MVEDGPAQASGVVKRRILAAFFTLLFAGSCSQPSSSGGSRPCDQFVGAKKSRCEKGMTDVSNAVDQYNDGG